LSGCSLFGGDTGQGPQAVAALDRWRRPARLVRNYAFCMIYPLFRRR